MVHASDTSRAALRAAQHNAAANGTTVRFYLADVSCGLESLAGTIDLLVSNPPYIPSAEIPNLSSEVRDWDPPAALDGGPNGLEFYRRIFSETPPLLVAGADVVLEVGDGQAEDVLALGKAGGFVPIGSRNDLAGSRRAVLLRWDG